MAEEIEKVDRLKNHFFSNISHELKTPVNVIFASAQLLGSISDRMEYKVDRFETGGYFFKQEF